MARNRKSVVIDGIPFDVGQVSSLEAFAAATLLMQVHGEVLGAYGRGGGGPVAGLGLSLAELGRQMRSAEYQATVFRPLLGQVTHANRPVLSDAVQEELFVGKPGLLVKLLKEAIEHNCGNFTDDFAGASEVVTLAASEVSKGLSTGAGKPSGSSGDQS